MKGDVTVLGLTMGQFYIEDIGISVPHMEVVTIPADKAYSSRDLWLGINQRRIFHLHAGIKSWGTANSTQVNIELVEQNRALRQALDDQRVQNATMLAAMAEQTRLVQELTRTVANLRGVPVQAVSDGTPVFSISDAPTYIPSTVKPEVTEQRIHGNEGMASGEGVDEARAKLRAMRGKR